MIVDREESDGRAVFRRHVGDRCTIRQRHFGKTWAEELHELVDHAKLAQDLRDGENQVRRRGAFRQLAGDAHTNNLRNQHVNRLTKHDCLGLNATNTPANHAQSVDHGGVTVGTNEAVWIEDSVLFPHHFCQVFKVYLMHNAGGWRHHAEV